MAKLEYINSEGLRIDGRKADEIRFFGCRMGEVSSIADGSALIEQGNTKVIAHVYGPVETGQRKRHLLDSALLSCEVTFAPFSMVDRRRKTKSDRLVSELSQGIRQTFQNAIFLNLYPRSSISIFVQILEVDGGVTSACMNAVCVALVDAGIAMKDVAAACGTTFIHSTPLVDANGTELQAGGAVMTLCAPLRSDKCYFIELDAKMPAEDLERMYDACLSGCKAIGELIQIALKDKGRLLLSNRH